LVIPEVAQYYADVFRVSLDGQLLCLLINDSNLATQQSLRSWLSSLPGRSPT
jgi:hypothetical protein